MNPKKLARKILPKKLIPASEVTFRKARLGATHLRYGLPARKLRVIAVTGTNGKTSTCNFLNDALRSAGYSTAMYTTAVIEMADVRQINTRHSTVPLASELFHFLRTAKAKRVDFVILEVTSHALQQHKLWGIPIEIAVMTNLTQDHLDYHGSMEAYAGAKARLFDKYMKPKVCVLNTDDEWFEYFHGKSAGKIVTYGKKSGSDVQIKSIDPTASGLKMDLEQSGVVSKYTASLLGEFNAYNLCAVVAILTVLGQDTGKIQKSIAAAEPVPGRMELVSVAGSPTIVVDYAHTPDALQKALEAIKQACTGQVSVVFGATGDRDKSKRPIMGKVAARLANHIYLTDDETYTENGDYIRAEVMGGIVKAGGAHKTTVVADRKEAIKTAISHAKQGDMVLVAGIGHQNYRAMAGKNIPWNEVEIVKEILYKPQISGE
jgi:UDP-N-acetylmuramoyl-L-alanyl-D-glutamate--2,6-diaminopimelate ligase